MLRTLKLAAAGNQAAAVALDKDFLGIVSLFRAQQALVLAAAGRIAPLAKGGAAAALTAAAAEAGLQDRAAGAEVAQLQGGSAAGGKRVRGAKTWGSGFSPEKQVQRTTRGGRQGRGKGQRCEGFAPSGSSTAQGADVEAGRNSVTARAGTAVDDAPPPPPPPRNDGRPARRAALAASAAWRMLEGT